MPVKYGVIGCGAIAQRRHIPECIANPDSVLIGIAEFQQTLGEIRHLRDAETSRIISFCACFAPGG